MRRLSHKALPTDVEDALMDHDPSVQPPPAPLPLPKPQGQRDSTKVMIYPSSSDGALDAPAPPPATQAAHKQSLTSLRTSIGTAVAPASPRAVAASSQATDVAALEHVVVEPVTSSSSEKELAEATVVAVHPAAPHGSSFVSSTR